MTTRFGTKIGVRAVFLVTVIGGGASPVLADCCDSWLSCAATVVTYGLSCEIETIIDTVKNLLNAVSNLKDLVTDTSNSAVTSARNWVTSTHDSLQSQAQQSAANMTAALAQAKTITQEEALIRHFTAQSTALSSQSGGSSAPQAGAAPPSSARFATKQSVNPAAAAPTAPSAGNSMQRTVAGGVNPAAGAVTLQSTLPPPGAFSADFALAVKQITVLQSQSTGDLPNITQNLQKALQTEGVGEQNAVGFYSTAINAPLESVKNLLSSILSDPLNAFDPSAQVQTVEDSVVSQLTKSVGTMVDDVMSGPKSAFEALTPSFNDLMATSQTAQAISAAMDRVYNERTPASVAALHELLPKQIYATASKTTVATVSNAKYAGGASLASMMGQADAVKQKATATIAARVQPFHAAAAQFKAQYAQRKQVQSASMLQMYRNKLTQQTSAAFDGKSSAAVNAQRDQLIAQARSVYAKDTKTQNSVIALLNQEAAKRTGNAGANVAASATSVATAAVGASAMTSNPSSTIKPVPRQVTAVAPQAAPLVPAGGPMTAPAVAVPASTAPKANAWGSAPPAWSPPVSNSVSKPPVATSPLGAPRPIPGTTAPIQTAQPLKPQAPVQPPPSSLTSH